MKKLIIPILMIMTLSLGGCIIVPDYWHHHHHYWD